MFIGQYDEMNFSRKQRSDKGKKRGKRIGQAAAALGGAAAIYGAAKNRKAIGGMASRGAKAVGNAGFAGKAYAQQGVAQAQDAASRVSKAASKRVGQARQAAGKKVRAVGAGLQKEAMSGRQSKQRSERMRSVGRGLTRAGKRISG